MNTKFDSQNPKTAVVTQNNGRNIFPIKYIFLDVVGFTKDRSTDAQIDILQRLNSAVRSAIELLKLTSEKIIFLPTGDGMCIALVDVSQPFDVHIQIATNLISLLQTQNSNLSDETRKFQIRIGLNECDDILVQDINNSKNVAGLGINIASRVMELADASQIMVSAPVHERLRSWEKYMPHFSEFWAKIKHGEPLNCFQYIDKQVNGLNCETPRIFQEEVKSVVIVKLDSKIAAYIAFCIKHKAEILEIIHRPIEKGESGRYFLKIMLWYMAEDHVAAKSTPEHKRMRLKTWGEGKLFLDRFKYYEATDFWLGWDFQDMISKNYLQSMWECFEPSSDFLVPSNYGLSKLKSDQPQIATDFGLMHP